ncbi:hypothetical protein COM86_25555 [Priestia megaterium]|nr:hypothetical protein COM86_25555 [Priestia megaterium]PEE73112.1 hypothetical protein COM81_30430 [Priestia megaterium]
MLLLSSFYLPSMKKEDSFAFKLLLFFTFHFLCCIPFSVECAPIFRAKKFVNPFYNFSFLPLS